MKLAEFRGSACLILRINTSTGRSSTYGFARSWRCEDRIPDWLVEILNARVPGFIETERALTPKAAKTRPLHFRLEDWIDEHIFAFAKQEGSFFAITYYAIRDPRYQRAEVCWSECTEKWKKAKPIQYPSFEEWKGMAAQCDETAHLLPRERRQEHRRSWCILIASPRLFSIYRLGGVCVLGSTGAGARIRTSRRGCKRAWMSLPRVPERSSKRHATTIRQAESQDWQRLMLWIADHYLPGRAKRGLVRCHPRPGAEPSAGDSDHGIRRPL